jgi:hypothetical protein
MYCSVLQGHADFIDIEQKKKQVGALPVPI